MPFEIITIPFHHGTRGFYADEMNRFCMNKKVIAAIPKFFAENGRYYWTVFMKYELIIDNDNGAGRCHLVLRIAGCSEINPTELRTW